MTRSAEGSSARPDPTGPRTAPGWARWAVAAIFVAYGFAKIVGSQFAVPEYVLDRRLGEVSGFWLTWHYYSYSTGYGTLLALVQIAGGLLLTFRRTWLVGALLLLPVAANILLVDLFYGVDLGATFVAALALGLLLYVLAPHARELWEEVRVGDGAGGRAAWAGRGTLVAAAAGFAWWAGHVNTRSPTPIDGVWRPAARTGGDLGHVEKVFFERERAFMAVVRDTSGTYRRHHFEVAADTVRVWERWLEKGTLLYRGTHSASPGGAPDTVVLRARGRRDGRLVLVRIRTADGEPVAAGAETGSAARNQP